MARLPIPGSDSGTWGQVLNDFLLQTHKTDGTLKDNIVNSSALAPGAVSAALQSGSVSSAKLADNSVTAAKLDADTPAAGEVLSFNGNSLEWITPAAASGSGESNTASNIGTGGVGLFKQKTGVNLELKNIRAASSKVTITNNPANDTVDLDINNSALGLTKTDVGLANVDNTADANKPVSTATQTALNAKANDTAVVHLSGAETVAGVKTFSVSPVVPTPTVNTQAANKSYVDSVAASGAADATTTTKGIIQLAGDLGGTAAAPTVPGLASKANTSHSHAAADITSGTIGAARLGSGTPSATTYLRGDGTWATPANSGVTLATLPAGTTITVMKSGGTWPVRPTNRTDIVVRWKGAAPGPNIDATYALNNVDDWDEI